MDVLVRLQGWSSDGAFSIFSLVLYPVLAGSCFLVKFSFCLDRESGIGKVREVTEYAISEINIIDIFKVDKSSLAPSVDLK